MPSWIRSPRDEALALVPAGVGDHEAQVRVDHPILGDEVALLDALRQLDLLVRLEQGVLARLAQEELQRVERGVNLVVRGPSSGARSSVVVLVMVPFEHHYQLV